MSDTSEVRPQNRRKRPHSIFGPLLIIGIGVVLLLKPLGVIEGSLWGLFLKTWPVLFIVGGLDSLYRGDSQVGGVVWTGLGVVFLLANLGYMQIAAWNVIIRLWPLLFVIWGLDILFHRRSLLTTILGLVIGFALFAVIAWVGMISPGEYAPGKIETFQPELDDVKRASISVQAFTGELWVGKGADDALIADAQIELSKGETLQKEMDITGDEGDLNIQSRGRDTAPYWLSAPDSQASWEIKLNDTIPLDLTTGLIVGKQISNLSGLQIESAELETILGQALIYLPDTGDYEIDASLIIGEMKVYVMANTPVVIELDTGLTALDYPDGFTKDGDVLWSPGGEEENDFIRLRINLPIGSLVIQYIE